MEIRVGMHDDATAGTISDWISGSSTFPARLHYKIDITNLGLITLFAKSAVGCCCCHTALIDATSCQKVILP